jgi:beta-lactamase class A
MLLATLLLAASLQQKLSTIVRPLDSRVGVAVVDVQNGSSTFLRADERFPMGSVYKLPIALTVLKEVDEGKIFLTDDATITPDRFAPGWSPLRDAAKGQPIKTTVGALLEQMVSVSDNTASDYLLDLVGGGEVVTKRMRELGVQNIRIDRRERDIAADINTKGAEAHVKDVRDTATPRAMADLLVKLAKAQDGLGAESHEVLLRWMTETQTGRNRIRAGIPADAQLAHKTGTMPLVVNDAGLITKPDGRQLVIVVFTKGGKAKDEAREKVMAEIAKAAYR